MKLVNINEKKITGLSLITSNEIEMNPDIGKIPILWQTFDNTVAVDYESGNRVYGIYYNYESDASGEFSVLAGTDQNILIENNLETVTILSAQYLVFEAKGKMPQAVIEAWGEVWAYFDNQNSEHQRAYLTDFEYYKTSNEVEVCISIKSISKV